MKQQSLPKSELVVAIQPQHERPFILVQELVYRGKWEVWRVPEGYRTDLASVPRWLWWALPPHGLYAKAAVVHDFLYDTRPKGVTRSDADGIMNRIMREHGVGTIRRWFVYTGVRIGGWVGWYRRWGTFN